jgi:hypothetical protein
VTPYRTDELPYQIRKLSDGGGDGGTSAGAPERLQQIKLAINSRQAHSQSFKGALKVPEISTLDRHPKRRPLRPPRVWGACHA